MANFGTWVWIVKVRMEPLSPILTYCILWYAFFISHKLHKLHIYFLFICYQNNKNLVFILSTLLRFQHKPCSELEKHSNMQPICVNVFKSVQISSFCPQFLCKSHRKACAKKYIELRLCKISEFFQVWPCCSHIQVEFNMSNVTCIIYFIVFLCI